MDALDAFERAILEKLLAGDHGALRPLRAQLDVCCVKARTWTGKGFFTELSLPEDVPLAELPNRHVRFGDVVAEIAGVPQGAGFLLFIDDGRLTMLEGYAFEGPWPEHPRLLALAYTSEPRDLSELGRGHSAPAR